jgi:hypothetical protein
MPLPHKSHLITLLLVCCSLQLSQPTSTPAYRMSFPGETPTKLIRRGTLTCQPTNGECAFVMLHTNDAKTPD